MASRLDQHKPALRHHPPTHQRRPGRPCTAAPADSCAAPTAGCATEAAVLDRRPRTARVPHRRHPPPPRARRPPQPGRRRPAALLAPPRSPTTTCSPPPTTSAPRSPNSSAAGPPSSRARRNAPARREGRRPGAQPPPPADRQAEPAAAGPVTTPSAHRAGPAAELPGRLRRRPNRPARHRHPAGASAHERAWPAPEAERASRVPVGCPRPTSTGGSDDNRRASPPASRTQPCDRATRGAVDSVCSRLFNLSNAR
ncbi:hypothetical protein HBB16_04360, partial [Pseudonocardia sp. MCCB 268]|nr:hypothetical protein [Pseudonocardia cytotoxica]